MGSKRSAIPWRCRERLSRRFGASLLTRLDQAIGRVCGLGKAPLQLFAAADAREGHFIPASEERL
ncbi:hypothetical protein TQ38_026335 (plasmid) [Novosphingobium sp. P6W]|nr:hypothetical protein TQ38_026335 [Novosphingobium sp. P6W]